jgi:hypothetical protein
MSPAQRIEHIRRRFPEDGLFRDKEWVLSPEPFPLPQATVAMLRDLGPALRSFQRACNDLYFHSIGTPDLEWVARWLDQGKPADVIALGRAQSWRQDLPRVLRPDLILTEAGVTIAELDSLPGGIGLTGWLNQTYASLGHAVIGGGTGMIDGFAAAFPHESLLISRESADYQPEMEWLVAQLNDLPGGTHRCVMNSWNVAPHELSGSSIYRFFELFDLDQVEGSQELLRMARRGELRFSPPLKAFLEEKLWLALFWTPQLEWWWREQLPHSQLDLLRRCIPQGWVVNPEPLPPFAIYPGLNIGSWQEAKRFGGKQRQLALKISGFSERGWGSRGVFIGHDLSQDQWAAALDEALASFPKNPFLLQEFHTGRVVEHPAWNEAQGAAITLKSRVRLCPYYFVPEGTEETKLGGVLATVCPADKKILHGMRDAMMLPCVPG